MVEIVPATIEHAVTLAPSLRQTDADEVMASSGQSPGEALVSSVAACDPSMRWTALVDGNPAVIWGAAEVPNDPTYGIVWLLGSDQIQNIRHRFMLESFRYTALMHERFKTLSNYVDARNVTSQKWLERLGFEVIGFDPEFGHERRPFLHYASFR